MEGVRYERLGCMEGVQGGNLDSSLGSRQGLCRPIWEAMVRSKLLLDVLDEVLFFELFSSLFDCSIPLFFLF
jgi:hypothetical protein